MDTLIIALFLVSWFILILIGLPVAFSFMTIGFLGVLYFRGLTPALSFMGTSPYSLGTVYTLITIPLFVLMGEFTFHSKISKDLFDTAGKWMARLPGGLASATVFACAMFAACTGSSTAGAATMGTIAHTEMDRLGYNRGFSAGCIAAGGTLGILIPPSIGFIIYGVITETSIARLFLAGIFPGILLVSLFILMITIYSKLSYKIGPPGKSYPFKEMVTSLKGTWGMLLLFVLVIGGMYLGIFTATEAAAVGASGALILALIRRRLDRTGFSAALSESLRITCFIITITIGALIFSTFIGYSGLTTQLIHWIGILPVPPHAILIFILIMYIPLGMLMDALPMILLTLPIVFPLIVNLGFNPIHFGVILTMMCEIAAISPPVAINLYVIHGITKVPMEQLFKGIIPFISVLCICVAIVIAFPQISLFLPNMMK